MTRRWRIDHCNLWVFGVDIHGLDPCTVTIHCVSFILTNTYYYDNCLIILINLSRFVKRGLLLSNLST